MKLYKIILPAVIVYTLGACTSGNSDKAKSSGPDTVRTDTSALHGGNSTNDSTSRNTASKTNQNADPSGRNK
ncbi:hypothetical protein [Mucilaginibacter panaciglaebae]|uniref:Lipoprotein n=1 Tax=Mucilaginibacter panaciglaebae TaxID=502331 RepID=A0ABP7WXJ4_9SPHI